MTRLTCLFLILIMLGIAGSAQDWLEGGFVGSPDYGEIRQYFTDPIFSTKVPVSQPLGFYQPYYPAAFSKKPLILGRYTAPSAPLLFQSTDYMNGYPYFPWLSDFRNKSLAAMQWGPFEKNWTATTNYAKASSSFKVLEKGAWRSI
jgi:hypothetical protein